MADQQDKKPADGGGSLRPRQFDEITKVREDRGTETRKDLHNIPEALKKKKADKD